MRIGKTTYRIDGELVNEKEFLTRTRQDLGSNGAPAIQLGWDLHSNAAGVNPGQRAEAEAYAKQCGVNTDFDPQGRPIFKSLRHQRRFLQTIHMHNADDNGGGPPGKSPESD